MRMALLGASVCGKSVTLKCIAGIMTPDRGHIILNGETLFDSEKHINLPPQKRRGIFLRAARCDKAVFRPLQIFNCFPFPLKTPRGLFATVP